MKKIFKIFPIICIMVALIMPSVYAEGETNNEGNTGDPETSFEVSFDDDGSEETQNVVKSFAEGSIIKVNYNDGVTEAEEIELSEDIEIPNPTREKYDFIGWSEEETQEYDLELKANWQIKTYTVTFYSNTEEDSTAEQSFEYDEEKMLTKNSFERAGYYFVKWNTLQDGTGADYEDEQSVINLTEESNVNLYAQWVEIPTYNISYDDDGDINTANISKSFSEGIVIKVDYNDETTIADEIVLSEDVDITNPTRDKYNFIGWSEEESQEYDLVLKANWQIKTYTVTFNSNTENASQVVQTFNFDEEKKLTKNSFTKARYTFVKWTTQADGKGTSYTDEQLVNNLTSEDNGNIDLYAQWEKITVYKVTIEASNGENITQKLVDVFEESKYYEQSIINIPSGTFWVGDDNNLVIHSNTQLILQSDTVLKKVANTQNSIIRTRASENSSNITITGGTFDCNNSSVNGLEIATAQNVTINNVKLMNAGTNKNGMSISNSTNVYLNNIEAANNIKGGIYVSASSGSIKNSKCYSNENGIMVVGNSNVNIDNVSTYSNNQRGLYIINSSASVTNSSVNENKTGVYINNSTISKFESNSIFNNSDDGIFITNNANRVTLKNVKSYSNTGHGINISTSTVTVNNSNVYSNKKCGIYANQTSKVTVESCKLYGNTQSGLSIANSSTVWLKNSNVYNNSEYGVYVNISKLYANDGANNKIYSNNYNGVSATGSGTEIYLHKNTITENGKAGKSTVDGEIGHGVGVAEKAYANITNNTIKNNVQCGISVFNGSKVKINKNTISGNGRHGIGIRQNCTIKSMEANTISNNSYNGILWADGTSGALTNNTITNNTKFGLSVVDKSTATLTSNTITGNAKSNIGISKGDENKTGAKVILKDSNYIASSTGEHGIVVSAKGILEISGASNKIEKNKKNGISLSDSSTLKISNTTTIYGNGESGIYAKKSNLEIKKAKIRKNKKYGVCLENGGDLNIWKSVINTNTNYGINVSGSGTTVKVSNNEIKENKIGIVVKNSAIASELKGNTIVSNTESGIMIKASASVSTIKNNTIQKHAKYGIAIYDSIVTKITGNSYSGNTKNVYSNM